MKTIRILETIRQGRIGGGESHVLDLCTHLDKSRYQPVVLSFTPGPMVDELHLRGIETKVINTEHAFDVRVWGQVRDLIRNEGIDIVHAHGTRANSNLFWAAHSEHKPLIYTVHGWSFHIDQSPVVRAVRELSERFLTAQADTTICVSASNEYDGKLHAGLQRSEVIYNAVDLVKFNPQIPRPDVRAQLGIGHDKTVIGYIVRITAQKDPFAMLRAMKMVLMSAPDTVLLMVGDGDLKPEAVALASELGIMDRVVFQPFRTDIPDLLSAVDIYCLPSLWEGFPIGMLEAMAMGVPVVASSVDGNRELVVNGVTGVLVNPGDVFGLAQALIKMVANPQHRTVMAYAARQNVLNNFSIDHLVRHVQDVYEKTLTHIKE